MKTYRIRPLPLSIMEFDQTILTYRVGYGNKMKVANYIFYIEGSEKSIIIDTAADAVQAKQMRGFTAENVMSFEQALASVNLKPENVDIVVQTHLHWDHCANTAKCKNARVIVSEEELKWANAPHPMFAPGYDQELFRGVNFCIISGRYELAPGIEMIPAPGHTPGTMAVAVNTVKGKAIVSGFCAVKENFYPPAGAKGNPPVLITGTDVDPIAAYWSALRIKGMADIIIPVHDVSFKDEKCIP